MRKFLKSAKVVGAVIALVVAVMAVISILTDSLTTFQIWRNILAIMGAMVWDIWVVVGWFNRVTPDEPPEATPADLAGAAPPEPPLAAPVAAPAAPAAAIPPPPPTTASAATPVDPVSVEVSPLPVRIEPISIKLLLFLAVVAIVLILMFGWRGSQEEDESQQGAWFISAILIVAVFTYVFICYKEVAPGRRALQKEGGRYTGRYYPTGPHLVWKPVYAAEDVEDEVEYAETTVSGPTRSRDGVTPGISMTVTGKTEYKRNWADLNEERVPHARLLDIDLEHEVQSFAAGPMVQALGLFYQEELIRSLDIYMLMVSCFMMLKKRPETMTVDPFSNTPPEWRDPVTGVILPKHMVEFYTRYQAAIRALVAGAKDSSTADIEDMLVIIMTTFLVMQVSEGVENKKTGEKQPETAQDRGQMDLALARQASGAKEGESVPLEYIRAVQVSTGRSGARVIEIVGGKPLERAAAVLKGTGGDSTAT